MKTGSVLSKRRDQYQSDDRETNNKLNPLYTLPMIINIFHDNIYIHNTTKYLCIDQIGLR